MNFVLTDLTERARIIVLADPLLKLRVSEKIYKLIEEWSGKQDLGGVTSRADSIYAVRLEVDTHYLEYWWSEHYRRKIILHTETGEVHMDVNGTTFVGEDRSIRFLPTIEE